MDEGEIACCLKCQTKFSTHEELFVHTCAQIKVEVDTPDNEELLNSYYQEVKVPELDLKGIFFFETI